MPPEKLMHYGLARAGRLSIRTACQRILRRRSANWTTAAAPVTCEECQGTVYFEERRSARGLC
jgi:hypothetical protein